MLSTVGQDLYKTVWEIKQKAVIDMAADRGAFICQSQSMNVHMADPTQVNSHCESRKYFGAPYGKSTAFFSFSISARAYCAQESPECSQKQSMARTGKSFRGCRTYPPRRLLPHKQPSKSPDWHFELQNFLVALRNGQRSNYRRFLSSVNKSHTPLPILECD